MTLNHKDTQGAADIQPDVWPVTVLKIYGKLKKILPLHRVFTFFIHPKSFREEIGLDAEKLAAMGLFCTEDLKEVRCNFCEFSAKLEVGIKEQVEQRHTSCKLSDINDRSLPSQSNYKYVAWRLYTFLKKTNWEHVNPLDLAENGFYFIGDGDMCRCVFCNLEVKDWEEGDTPNGEHTRWNPSCPFLKNQSNLNNINIGEDDPCIQHDGIGKLPEGAKKMTEEEIISTTSKNELEKSPTDPNPVVPMTNESNVYLD